MKYLKRFNEELEPRTYKDAGRNLLIRGHTTRGHELIDYGHEKEYGLFKMWTANDSTIIGRGETYSFSKVEVIYGDKRNERGMVKTSVEDLITEYRNGSDLVVNFVFYFRPTGSTIKSSHNVDFLKKECDLFSFKYVLSHSVYDDDEPDYNREDDSLSDLYEYGRHLGIYLDKPANPHYFGVFYDRGSAYKFKKYVMPKVIEDVKESLFDIYSILSTNTVEYEECINTLSQVKVNQLYRTDVKKPSVFYNNNNIIE